jgi:hypothetical protein
VYYETYYDRDGTIADYGVTMNGVVTMTGKSTAVDRMYAKALVPWSVLDPRYGEVINDDGDIGNREAGLETDEPLILFPLQSRILRMSFTAPDSGLRNWILKLEKIFCMKEHSLRFMQPKGT